MQRRIGLAQALINDPDLVILDEPTSGLDPLGCREVKDLIIALAKRGKTVILSSHLLSDVEDVCDRVVIYYGGKIQAIGTLNELLATPEQVRITAPILPRETLEKVMQVIRKDVAEDRVRIDTPTQNLENYFLNVVNKARAAEAETSGATSGNKVAAYLRGGAEEGPGSKARILDRLSKAEPEPVAPAPTVTVTDVQELQHKKLEQLTKNEEEPSAMALEQAKEETKKVELEKANEKLSGLLGKPK
jgi:ABC-2 type transport system ATP-binding protein